MPVCNPRVAKWLRRIYTCSNFNCEEYNIMKKAGSRLLIFGIVFIILLGVLFAIHKLASVQQPEQKPFSSVHKEDIISIVISQKETTTSLYKKNTHWYIKVKGEEIRADEDLILPLLDSFISLVKTDPISRNKEKHKELGIENQKIEFKMDKKKFTLFIGDIFGMNSNYVRIDNEDDVYGATGFGAVFQTLDFRDLKAHLIEDESHISAITLTTSSKTLHLIKKGGDWMIEAKKAKKDRVDFFLNDLATLKSNDLFSSNDLKVDFSTPSISITVKEKVNASEPAKTMMFVTKDSDSYYALLQGSTFIFQIPTVYVNSLLKEEKDFID